MFERFTDRSRRVLVLAQEHARKLADDFIGTEHLLLGLATAPDGVTADVLSSFQLTEDRLVEAVRRRQGPRSRAHTGSPPFNPDAKRALEQSLREAVGLGSSDIGTEHLLLGVLAVGAGTGAAVLADLGVDQKELRAAVLESVPASEPIDEKPAHLTRLRCPSCHRALEGQVGYRTVDVISADEPPGIPSGRSWSSATSAAP